MIGNGKGQEEDPRGLFNFLGKWNDHYHSWTKYKENLLLIKYEDLIQNPENELFKIIEFLKRYLKFETSEQKNEKILETTTFKNLKKMEEEGQFLEYAKDKINFFHLGPDNKWQDIIDKKIISQLEKNFYKEMRELGYLR